MSSSKCSFTCICGIFWPLNPSTTAVYARSAFYPSLRFTLSVQSAFYTQSAFYPWSAVCSPQSAFYTDRFPFHSLHSVHFICRKVSRTEINQRFDHFTLARSSLIKDYFKLYRRGSKSAQNLIVGEFLWLSIVLLVFRSDKLAVDSLVLLVCGLSLIPPKRK